jgi:hypothetical protein
MSDTVPLGSRVRVRQGCPHTLPHFARALPGEVVGPPEGGLVQVKFGERFFPVAVEWLEILPPVEGEPED